MQLKNPESLIDSSLMTPIVIFHWGTPFFSTVFWEQKGPDRRLSKIKSGILCNALSIVNFLYVHEAIGGIIFRANVRKEALKKINSLPCRKPPIPERLERKLFHSRRKLETKLIKGKF